MEKIILVSGVEYPDAMEAARWYANKGDKVYACYTDRVSEAQQQEGLYTVGINLFDESQIKAVTDEIEKEDGKIDVLILRAGKRAEDDGVIGTGHAYGKLLEVLDYNINGTKAMIDAALPLLRKSGVKRIALLNTKAVSINWSEERDDFAYHMSLAALNMMEKLYFNLLRPEMFTFRCFCTDDMDSGISAGEYIENGLCYDEKEPYIHSDENRLVMRDNHYREIPW